MLIPRRKPACAPRPEAPGCYTNLASTVTHAQWNSGGAQSLCLIFGPMKEEVSVRDVDKRFCLHDKLRTKQTPPESPS